MSEETSKKWLKIQEELAQQGTLEDKQESFERTKNLPIEQQLKAEPGEQDQHSSLVRPASIYPVNSFFTFVNWPWRALSTSRFEMPPKKATILPPRCYYCTITDFNFTMTPYKIWVLPRTNDYCTKTDFNFDMIRPLLTPYTSNRELLAAVTLLLARVRNLIAEMRKTNDDDDDDDDDDDYLPPLMPNLEYEEPFDLRNRNIRRG
jgi:hypothetical protein